MKNFQRLLISLMVFFLMVGNTGWVINHLAENEKASEAFAKRAMMQDPRPIGFGHGIRR